MVCICVHTHTHCPPRYHSAKKKGWNNAICKNVDGSVYQTKWSQLDKDRYHMTLFIHGLLCFSDE